MANDTVLIAYAVKRNSKTKRAVWTRVGCAYPHDVGAGLTVVLDSVPLEAASSSSNSTPQTTAGS